MGKGKGKGKGKGSSKVAKGGKGRKVRRGAPAAMERGRVSQERGRSGRSPSPAPSKASSAGSVACVITKIKPPRRI